MYGQMQPNLPQMRPNANCHARNHIAPHAAASAAPPALSAGHAAGPQMTSI
jgi:hypothetical protein